MSVAQLQEVIEKQDLVIKQLQEDAVNKENTIRLLETKINKLEGQMNANMSLHFVRERVTEELKSQLDNLQQYTRRHSAIIAGVEKKSNESQNTLKQDIEEILREADSTTTMDDVDKFHRVGPMKNSKQDIVVRFKTHSAKEQFFLRRKQIKRNEIKIRPSLTPARRELLDEAYDLMDEYKDETRNTHIINPPHFVYADMHGNLKLKMTKSVNGRLFFNFNSIVQLSRLIDEHQKNEENQGTQNEENE